MNWNTILKLKDRKYTKNIYTILQIYGTVNNDLIFIDREFIESWKANAYWRNILYYGVSERIT
jgi:hypothetical protein